MVKVHSLLKDILYVLFSLCRNYSCVYTQSLPFQETIMFGTHGFTGVCNCSGVFNWLLNAGIKELVFLWKL